jgi:hypothetical protein
MRRVVLTAFALAFGIACSSTPAATSAPSAAAATTAAPTAAPTTAAPTPAPSTPKPATPNPLAAFADGKFTGTWNNTTFGSTGNATFDVKVDQNALTLGITVTLTGNVFGAPAPAPETFTIPVAAIGTTYKTTSKTFGDVTATIKDGAVTIDGTNVPGGRVKSINLTGTYTPTAINMNYTVALSDGTQAKGTVAMKKA